ncbi:MAG: 2-oxo acid dehydrogenase subunit E2 [Betaproteobacteria bacterium]|nr:2-oxo acid dehydrogenase subunit E2 [Betaproteobacteria bacterium]
MAEFRMPKLGADMTSGKLVAWCRKPGERIERGETIAVIETDKANVDVESFFTGVIERILVEPGDRRIPVGTPLALLAVEGETASEAVPAAASAPAAPIAKVSPAITQMPAMAPSAARAHASPAARQRAQELGIDLARVAGTGPQGRITREDVERAAARTMRPPELAAAAPATTPGAAAGAESRQQRMRDAIATAMARSKREIPHYYLATAIDLTRVNAWIEKVNRERPVTERLLYGIVLIKAVALALRQVPELNGSWIDNRAQTSEAIHTGVAISLRGGGLVAPALHHADQRSLGDLMANFSDLVKRARAGSLKGAEVTDPTITITSLGERGVETVFGIIYPPQLALVGFGKPAQRPWVEEGQVVARTVITATLAGDHRATDGHRGALFLDALARLLQQPESL